MLLETIAMIEEQNLMIRTITMGFPLDCIDPNINRCGENLSKITTKAANLVAGDETASELGIPIVNKRVSRFLWLEQRQMRQTTSLAKALDKAAKEIGGLYWWFSAWYKRLPKGDDSINSIPRALAERTRSVRQYRLNQVWYQCGCRWYRTYYQGNG